MADFSNSKNKTGSGKNDHKFPDKDYFHENYIKLLPKRSAAARELEKRIKNVMASLPSSPRVKGRIKSFESYFKKYMRLLKSNPQVSLTINDVIGIRVICLFLEDLAAVEKIIKEKFTVVEVERKGRDHTFREFGYDSVHLLLVIPEDITKKRGLCDGETAEIQIRTILQDAWAEVEHELIYKSAFNPFDTPLKRKLAAVNASLTLADIIFQDIRKYQRELNGELGQRRQSFFEKIENSTDAVLFSTEKPAPEKKSKKAKVLPKPLSGNVKKTADFHPASIDDLLLAALGAHNKNLFDEAIAIYTQILAMKPDSAVGSLIYKHRGMAHFACSHYEEAIADFAESLKLDPQSYKAAYYEGIVCSVLQRYPQALDAFNRSLKINPYQSFCLFRRGQVYFHIEDYPQALADCEAALALEPFDAVQKFRDLLLTKLKM